MSKVLKGIVGLVVACALFGVAFAIVKSKWDAAEAERLAMVKGAAEQAKAARSIPIAMDGPPADYNIPLMALTGHKGSLEAFRGKVIFLNYWATWCPPCREEMPSIQSLYQTHSPEGVAFVLVTDEEPEVVQAFIKKSRFTMPIFILQGDWPEVFDTDSIPATWIISKEGKVVYKHIGYNNWSRPAVYEMLHGLLKAP